MKHLLTLIAAAGFIALVSPTVGSAQTLNMDMSWGIRQQMQNQRYAENAARNAAQQYYNYMQELRRRGYTGPSLPTGVTPETLRQSNQALQQQYDRNNRAWSNNSQRTTNAVEDYTLRAIRGCEVSKDSRGNRTYHCP